MKTGSHLKIKSMGDNAMGVKLEGNPQKPEPIYFRVMFPGGDVDIVRTTDDEYWIHIHVNNNNSTSYDPMEPEARIVDARLDIADRGITETNMGDFNNPNLFHLAVRIGNKEAH